MRAVVLLWMLAGAAAAEPRLLILGDSLSAAYGIDKSAGWVALLQDRLRAEAFPHRVVNLSVAGETTAGGLRRLPGALDEHGPAVVLIELGANDGLRGLSLEVMRANLREMVEQAQAAGARVLLFEMRIPTNYGPRYAGAFRQSFRQVSEATGTALQPFFLRAIAEEPAYFQDDGIHPEAHAQPLLLEAVWPQLLPLLRGSQAAAGP